MRDGSDAIADWPILNALVNVAAGATWVSVHHGGGVGIGNSIHAGMVVRRRRDRRSGGAPRARADDRSRAWASCATSTPAIPRRSPRASTACDAEPGASSDAASVRRLLVRDLAQVATPAAGGADAAPRRGARARSTVIEDAYVLCADGAIEAVGRMRDLPARRRRGRGARRPRPVRDPRPRRLPHASGVRRRPGRGVLAARGRRDVRGAARGGRRDPLDRRARRARSARTALAARVARHAAWMLRHGTTTWEGKSGYGLDRDTELASLRAVRGGGRAADLARRARRAARVRRTPTRTSTSRSREVLPEASADRDGRRRLPRARRVRRGAGAAVSRRRAATPGSRCGCTATSSRRAARSRSRSSSARARSTTSRRPATDGVARARRERRRRRAAAGERALPRPADAAGARARRRGRGDRARDRLQPGQLVHDEPAARLLARVHAAAALARPRRWRR